MKRLLKQFSGAAPGDTITVTPGEYIITGEIPLRSGTRVLAHGAVFRFPHTLGNAHVRMFVGRNIRDFSWYGGKFVGEVYDPLREENPWEPSAESVGIHIEGGEDLHFEGIAGENLAGPILSVNGSEDLPVCHLKITGLTAVRCGRFMWDYGYLWQRITFPEHHTATETANAYRYMPQDCYSDPLRFDGMLLSSARLPQKQPEDDAVTFFGSRLPPEIQRGRYYYAEESEGGLFIRERLEDAPIRFTPGDWDVRMFRGIFRAYHAMYAPIGGGTYKGAVDVRFAEDLQMTGCTLSASGDCTHFHHCKNGEIRDNRICGARMGAMFLSSGCENMLVTGNIVDGGCGSRVLTVETGGKNISIIGNIFKNGGRGTWIDTPHGILLEGNIFAHNTGKGTQNPAVGRISPTEGGFEQFAEIYFTTRQHGAVYGGITLRNNLIRTGEGCVAALAFHAHGRGILLEGNAFEGKSQGVYLSPACEEVQLAQNYGSPQIMHTIRQESFDIPGTIYLPEGRRK